MPQNHSDFDALGDAIEAIIDQAISSQNFQRMNQTIRQVVSSAVDTGSEAVRRAVDEAAKKSAAASKPDVVEERGARQQPRQQTRRTNYRYQPNVNIYSSKLGTQRGAPQQSNLPVLYQNTSGKLAGGIVKTVFGGLMTFFGSGGLLASGIVSAVVGGAPAGIAIPGAFAAAVLGGGVWLLSNGIRTIGKVNRFGKYVRALGQKTHCELARLARAVGKPEKFVKKELKGMIDDGLFLEGHLDEEGTSLITSDDTFTHYLQTKRQQAVQKQQEVVDEKRRQDEADARKLSAQVQEVLDKGNAYLVQIRKCNDAIPGVEISEKITRMETIIAKIFDRAKSHPEIVPDLKKLMDYYLPMTVKLLNAYADMDAQPIQGETIMNSKKEIEATLDTLNNAFEKLLDSIFKDTALDVSSDISVLQTLLAQEGLTGSDFDTLRKKP